MHHWITPRLPGPGTSTRSLHPRILCPNSIHSPASFQRYFRPSIGLYQSNTSSNRTSSSPLLCNHRLFCLPPTSASEHQPARPHHRHSPSASSARQLPQRKLPCNLRPLSLPLSPSTAALGVDDISVGVSAAACDPVMRCSLIRIILHPSPPTVRRLENLHPPSIHLLSAASFLGGSSSNSSSAVDEAFELKDAW